jgi:hypothetical protein
MRTARASAPGPVREQSPKSGGGANKGGRFGRENDGKIAHMRCSWETSALKTSQRTRKIVKIAPNNKPNARKIDANSIDRATQRQFVVTLGRSQGIRQGGREMMSMSQRKSPMQLRKPSGDPSKIGVKTTLAHTATRHQFPRLTTVPRQPTRPYAPKKYTRNCAPSCTKRDNACSTR